MRLQEKPLQQHVLEMRKLTDSLSDYTFPNVEFEEEYLILPLKCRTIIVDGYDIAISFSRADYPEYSVESVHFQSIYTPFLPFNFVIKIAQSFLGKKHLTYVDLIKNNKKIYCWSVRKKENKVIAPSPKSRPTSYEGFGYNITDSRTLNLYHF